MRRKVLGQGVYEALLLLLALASALLLGAFWGWAAIAGDSPGGSAPPAKLRSLPLPELPAGAGGAAASAQLTKAAMAQDSVQHAAQHAAP